MSDYSFGKFVWFELRTRSPAEGLAFYTECLPWTSKQMTFPGGSYTMFLNGDRAIGGIAPLGDDMNEVANHWLSWISVDDVDAVAAKVTEHGGKLVAGPMDMPDMMRMAFCLDPEGAPFAIMKNTTGDPPDTDSQPGGFHWNELCATDAQAQVDFYRQVFGYEVEEIDLVDGSYYIVKSAGRARGGIMPKPVESMPSMWIPYVHIEDVIGTVKKALQGGSNLINPIMGAPGVGRFCTFRDPEGAAIAVITPPGDAV